MDSCTFRRCHHCETLLVEEREQITRCDGCGAHLAPFYFFKDTDVPVYSDNALRPETRVAVMWGFATTWSNETGG